MRAMRQLCLAALVLAVLVPPATAGTFRIVGLDDLVRTSTAAIEGEVLDTILYWDEEGRIIVTEAKVQVHDRVFGDSASILRVKTFGGRVGDYIVDAPGFPTFEKGEQLFLFVTPAECEEDMVRVTGYQQGQFRVHVDQDDVVRADSAIDLGSHLVELDGTSKRLPASLPLSELKELVREEAEIASGESR